MNWRSVIHLSEDDYGKPLLFRMPYNDKLPDNYFAAEIDIDGDIYALAYVTEDGFENSFYIMNVRQMPRQTKFLRIDEIKY